MAWLLLASASDVHQEPGKRANSTASAAQAVRIDRLTAAMTTTALSPGPAPIHQSLQIVGELLVATKHQGGAYEEVHQ